MMPAIARRIVLTAVFGALLSPAFSACAAAQPEAEAEVRSAVLAVASRQAPPGAKVTVGATVGATIMEACRVPLSATLAGTGPYQTATVKCASPVWTLYVPVEIAATRPVVVATKQITIGQRIAASDIRVTEMPSADTAGSPIGDAGDIVGMVAARPVGPGSIVTKDDISSPVVVDYNQSVAVIINQGGMQMTIRCRAVGEGKIGQMVPVEYQPSGKRFQAKIVPAWTHQDAGLPVIVISDGAG
jgi:flagella basal body P-ring formation protein FlgA